MISSAVWIEADRESVLSVSNGRSSPIETDKADSLSDTLHTSAYHTAGAEFPDNPFLVSYKKSDFLSMCRLQSVSPLGT